MADLLEQTDMDDTTRNNRIRELRSLGWLQKAIAAEVGCSQATVSRILDPAQQERMRQRYQTDEYRQRHREWHREWYAANPARVAASAVAVRERARRWREQNPERAKAAMRAHYELNRERIRAEQQLYREENLERLQQAARERYRANPERARAYVLANPEVIRARHARRRTRLRGIDVPLDAIDRLLSVEYRKAIAAESCTYCPAPGEQDDHILPLARGGTDHWWNLQRTCGSCNYRKHTKTHEEFLLVLARRAS